MILILYSCEEKTVNFGKDISFDKEMNISYGTDSQQKLDLYIPKNKDSIKGIFVIIHCGGWRAGDKSNLTFFTLSLMQKLPDYAFANMNYRLADVHSFVLPNQTNDIDSALCLLVKRFNNPNSNLFYWEIAQELIYQCYMATILFLILNIITKSKRSLIL